jgi:DNA-binding FadR family transcriptional regulator
VTTRAESRRGRGVTAEAIAKIREQIASGAWGPGTKLPREADLAAELGLSRSMGDRDALELARDEHLRIYEAIVDSNPELARAATAIHIATNEQWLQEHLAPDQGVPSESRDL